MKSSKKIRKPYAVWDYELEVCELNRESENGWQLVHGGLFHRDYEKNESIVYRYQLDFNNKEDATYYEMFKEQGWEFVNSTINGWNYFRKPYDKNLDENEYSIYTDRESKKKMNLKFINFIGIIFLAAMIANVNNLVIFLEAPKIATSGIIFFYGMYIFMFIRARVGVQRTAKGILPKRRSKIELYLFVVIFFLVFMIRGLLGTYEIEGIYDTKGQEENIFVYNAKSPDFYYIDFGMKEDAVLALEIENEDGDIVFTKDSIETKGDLQRVFLRKGEYRCIITSISETRFTIRIE